MHDDPLRDSFSPGGASAAEAAATALADHADAALLLLSAARSVLGSEAAITPAEQSDAAAAAVRTAASCLQMGGLDQPQQTQLLSDAAAIIAAGGPSDGLCGPPICLPWSSPARLAASPPASGGTWTSETVEAGMRPLTERDRSIQPAAFAAWTLDVAATTSLSCRHIPVAVDADNAPLSLVADSEHTADETASLRDRLLHDLVAGDGAPAALTANSETDVWPFAAHPQTWARAGVLRSSAEAAGEALLRTCRALRLINAAAVANGGAAPVGVDPRGVIEETYEGAAFAWVWTCAVLCATPDNDFVEAFLAAATGKWATNAADTAVSAARLWLRGNNHPHDSPEVVADLAECRRTLIHVAQCSADTIRGVEHICTE